MGALDGLQSYIQTVPLRTQKHLLKATEGVWKRTRKHKNLGVGRCHVSNVDNWKIMHTDGEGRRKGIEGMSREDMIHVERLMQGNS